jgi:hypothetical protein
MALYVRVAVALFGWGLFHVSSLHASEIDTDEKTLQAVGIPTDGPGLLSFFHKQTVNDAARRQVRLLIEQLGADSFQVREKASADLIALGPVALQQLRQAGHQAQDIEVRRRARACMERIEAQCPTSVAGAALRVLAARKPPGAAAALLAYLPGPYEDSLGEEIHSGLVAVAHRGRALDPALIGALASDRAECRVAAAVALCRVGAVEQRPAIRKLLQDPSTEVRSPVAQELAIVGDKEAVPVLIELLAQLPLEQGGAIEELLYRLAGPTSPAVALRAEAGAAIKCRDAWRGWWRQHGERIDLAVLKDAERPLGYTLLVLLNDNRVVEWDRDGKPRWQIDRLAAPLDAEVLPGQRVLIAEHDTKRVTERNFKGEVLWEKKLAFFSPIHAQRLPGGNTFIATRNELLEVDRAGKKEVIRYRSGGSIITARRYPDGRIGCIENGSYFELNADGTERRRFAVGAGVHTTNSLTLLPNGHLLIVSYGGGTIQEYDRAGKVVWNSRMTSPLCALRLPNGNTLVSSQQMVLAEFDRAGKEVGRREAKGHPCQIRRR